MERTYTQAEVDSILRAAFPLATSEERAKHLPPTGSGRLIGLYITFSPCDPEVGNAVISPDEPEEGLYWTLIASGGEADQNAVAAEICRRLNATVEG